MTGIATLMRWRVNFGSAAALARAPLLAELEVAPAVCSCLVACLLLTGCGMPVDSRQTGAPASRIITLSPHLTELVFTAGAGDRLVGVVEYSDYPDAALGLARVGDAFRLDFEAIAELSPDLVLAWESGTPRDVRGRLRDMGIRVVSLDAAGLDSIAAQLVSIGSLAGTSAIADTAAAAYRERLGHLRRRYADAAILRVFYQISMQPLFTISGAHVISEAIEVCGGRNVFAEVRNLSPAVSLEAVIAARPDVIVAGDDNSAKDAREKLRAQWSGWTSIPAVRTDSLYIVDADLMHRPTTRILDAVADLCRQLDDARDRRD